MAGKAIPNADKQKAPTNEMNKPKSGIVMARMTEKKANYISIRKRKSIILTCNNYTHESQKILPS